MIDVRQEQNVCIRNRRYVATRFKYKLKVLRKRNVIHIYEPWTQTKTWGSSQEAFWYQKLSRFKFFASRTFRIRSAKLANHSARTNFSRYKFITPECDELDFNRYPGLFRRAFTHEQKKQTKKCAYPNQYSL